MRTAPCKGIQKRETSQNDDATLGAGDTGRHARSGDVALVGVHGQIAHGPIVIREKRLGVGARVVDYTQGARRVHDLALDVVKDIASRRHRVAPAARVAVDEVERQADGRALVVTRRRLVV